MGPAYRLAARVVHRWPFPPGTLAASLAGRRAAPPRWHAWAAARGPDPLVWAHAASLGETQAVLPVVARLRARVPGLAVILTHTSPSVTGHPLLRAFDRADYLPLDEPAPIAALLDALRPSLLLFSRGDLWPETVTRAAARGVPVAVAGATVRPRSARLRTPAIRLLRPVHRAVTWLGAASGEDAARWRRLGVPADRVAVTGDPRHDQVIERLPDLGPARRWQAAGSGALTLVAGSVEPDDDALLAQAARLAGGAWRWLVIPHSPMEGRARSLAAAFRRRRLSVARWDGASNVEPAAVTILSRPGILADLYWAADVAYVGGGWKTGALHAVCEAAVTGVPVVAGPRLGAVRDGALLEAGGGGSAGSTSGPGRLSGGGTRGSRPARHWSRGPPSVPPPP
jgi:3-deoxy-D-manno-octulosonic-acid transferase